MAQVHGKNRRSDSAKGCWLARGVETLLWQYPTPYHIQIHCFSCTQVYGKNRRSDSAKDRWLARRRDAGVRGIHFTKTCVSTQTQVYGKNRRSDSAKGRWLARGVETLLWQYPALNVAYLDGSTGGDAGGEAGVQYAVSLPYSLKLISAPAPADIVPA